MRSALIREQLSLGRSRVEIAEQLGISVRTVAREKSAMGLVKPQSKISQQQKDFAKYLLDEGASFSEVSRSADISRRYLGKLFPEARRWTPSEGITQSRLNKRLDRVCQLVN